MTSSKKKPAPAPATRARSTKQRTGTLHEGVQDQPLWIRDSQGRIQSAFKVDEVVLGLTSVLIRGWTFGQVWIDVHVDGKSIAWRAERQARPDVAQALGLGDPGAVNGFSMRAQIAPGTEVPRLALLWRCDAASGESPLKPTSLQPEGLVEDVNDDLVISGWTVTRGGGPDPQRVEVLIDGTRRAEGHADIVRPDLITRDFSRAHGGFRINAPRQALTRLKSAIEVRVDGHTLKGSPKEVDFTGRVSAAIRGIRQGRLQIELQGWPAQPDHCVVRADADSRIVATPDTPANKQTREGATFSAPLPAEFCDGQLHAYTAEVHFCDATLCTDVALIRYPDYAVFVDSMQPAAVSGWAFRGDGVGLRLGIFRDGALLGETIPSLARQDVSDVHGPASENAGFHFDLPDLPRAGQFTLDIRDLETGVTLARINAAYAFDTLKTVIAQLSAGTPGDGLAVRAVMAEQLKASPDALSFSCDYLPPAPRAPAPAVDKEVAVIVPIYGGAVATAECIESVLAAHNNTPSRVILINDCSPDPLITSYLRALKARGLPNVQLIERSSNGGFSQSVNIGMVLAGSRDVILLNADTVVQDHWIDRMAAAAHADARIATVTPFSNNGEIATAPYLCKSLAVTSAALARRVDQAAARVNAGHTVEIPVAIGFCMYIRRACLDQVGLFDAQTWGRGYGEEVDFCVKATALGWRHVLTTDTFVVHRGNVSFGSEKLERVLESSRKISARYPFYDSCIQRFLATDPPLARRRALNMEVLLPSLPARRVLHVTHAFGGGTEQYVQDLAALYADNGVHSLMLRFAASGDAQLEMKHADTQLEGLFEEVHLERYAKGEVAALQDDLRRLGIERVHLHAPFGIPRALLDWLADNYTFDITVHDYAWLCPRVTLTHPGGSYCGEPEPQACDQCISRYGAHPGLKAPLADAGNAVDAYRTYFARFFDRAHDVYTGSADVAQRLHKHGWRKKIKATEHPHPAGSPFLTTLPSARRASGKHVVTAAVFGAISDIKGFFLLRRCAEIAHDRKLPLRFVVFGYTMDDTQFAHLPNVQITGKYSEDTLDDLVEDAAPDVSLFLHQWPETYSYTFSHAQRLRVWPITLELGAPAERVRATGYGSIIQSLGRSLTEIAEDVIDSTLKIHPSDAPLPTVKPVTLENYKKAKAI